MRLTNLLLILLVAFTASAHTIKKVPRDATHIFGGIDVRSHTFRPGMPAFVILFGIGEQGNGTTDLRKIEGLTNHKELCVASDSFDFNFFAVQTPSAYLNGEIRYARDYLIKELGADSNRIYLLTMSNGGYGYAGAADRDPELPDLFAAVAQVAMGPGERINTAKNIAVKKRPHWLFVAADDAVTPPTNTTNLYNKARALGGNVYLTKWIKGGHGVLGRVVGSWGNKRPYNWAVATCNPKDNYGATELCDPAYNNIYEWCFANIRGEKVYAPTELKAIATPGPIAQPAPVIIDTIKRDTIPATIPTVKPTLVGINVSPDLKNRTFFIDIFYSDGSRELLKSELNDPIKNAWLNLKADPKITITFQVRPPAYRTRTKP